MKKMRFRILHNNAANKINRNFLHTKQDSAKIKHSSEYFCDRWLCACDAYNILLSKFWWGGPHDIADTHFSRNFICRFYNAAKVPVFPPA
jgi:hypothetical protein